MKRAQLEADLKAYMRQGGRIECHPIYIRDDDLLVTRVKEPSPHAGRKSAVTPEMIGKALLLNKQGWSRDNIGRNLGVSRTTVTRMLVEAGKTTRAIK